MSQDEAGNFAVNNLGPEEQKEFWASLALRHCKGLGSRKRKRLLDFFGSASGAADQPEAWSKAGISSQCIKEFLAGKWRAEAKKEWECAKKCNANVLLWPSPLFPENLRNLIDAPCLLYFEGKPELLKFPAVALVGSRDASAKSQAIACALAQSLSHSGISVVSGMAIGIDSQAHHGALAEIGSSIGVLGTGINHEYPYSNRRLYGIMRQKGLLLSEFAPDAPPVPRNFPVRNRIISGLSLGVVVVEAAIRSGSLVTARLALEQGREVFAVPAPPLSDQSMGCQNLMREGAHPVFNVDDILSVLHNSLKAYQLESAIMPTHELQQKINIKKPRASFEKGESSNTKSVCKALNGIEPSGQNEEIAAGQEVAKGLAQDIQTSLVLKCLTEQGPLHIDALANLTGINSVKLNSLLIFMEMLGTARRLPGARYEAII